MTQPFQPAFLVGALNLSPEIINRLTALKSLLELGDLDLVAVAADRLVNDRQQPQIAETLGLLENHRYAEAAALINRLLSRGTRLVRWSDPEIRLLEAELERATTDLADLETELAELHHLVARFQATHYESLGERLRTLLRLRLHLFERQIRVDPERRSAYDRAKEDFKEFEREQEVQREDSARTKWDLSSEEQKDLKSLFRKGSKHCHPDLVPAEHHDAAAQMFRELRDAYDEGDLERLRRLVKRAETGLFLPPEVSGETESRTKQRLRARIDGIREAIDRARAGIDAIRRSPSYATMTEHDDWAALFEAQARQLDHEIEKLTITLEEMPDEVRR